MQTVDYSLSSCFKDLTLCREEYNTWDDRPSITTNEQMFFNTMLLANATGNTMIATSGLFALNLFAIREMGRSDPDQVVNLIVIDRSRRVEHFWQEMTKAIRAAQTENEVVEKIKALLFTHKELYFSGGPKTSPEAACQEGIANLQTEITRGISWLAEESRFKKVKKLFLQNRFAFLRLDFCDASAMQSLSKSLAEHTLTLDTVYLSNSYEYTIIAEPLKPVRVQKALQNSFRAGMALLLSPTTYVVDTKPRACYACDPLQQRTRIRGTTPIVQFFEELPHTATALPCNHNFKRFFVE